MASSNIPANKSKNELSLYIAPGSFIKSGTTVTPIKSGLYIQPDIIKIGNSSTPGTGAYIKTNTSIPLPPIPPIPSILLPPIPPITPITANTSITANTPITSGLYILQSNPDEILKSSSQFPSGLRITLGIPIVQPEFCPVEPPPKRVSNNENNMYCSENITIYNIIDDINTNMLDNIKNIGKIINNIAKK
jgi:hypothetical protein